MGARGPQPKPGPNESAVQATHGDMAAPSWLIDGASEHWDAIQETLQTMGIESPIYNPALAMLCNAMGRYLQFERELTEAGGVTASLTSPSVSPQARNRNAAAEEVRRLLREFGLTPVALSSIRKSRPTRAATKDQNKGILGLISPKLVG